jgi:hypothetical protein
LVGAYGVGKSSIAQEIVDILEDHEVAYALVDLDFLSWHDVGGPRTRPNAPSDDDALAYANIRSLMQNDRAAGIDRFVVAGTIVDAAERDRTIDALGVPTRVVRITASFEEIARRLRADVTSARARDLEEAAAQLARGDGIGIEDVTFGNDGPIREIASEILDWLGWLAAPRPRLAEIRRPR